MRALNCSSVPPVTINYVLNLIWETDLSVTALGRWMAGSILCRGVDLCRPSSDVYRLV